MNPGIVTAPSRTLTSPAPFIASAIKLLMLLSFSVGTAAGLPDRLAGQDPATSPDFATVEGTVRALYASLSFEAGGEPDWSQVRGFFLDQAVVVFAEGAGGDLRVLSADGFIEDFQTFYRDAKLVERGFSEVIDSLDISTFGHISHALVKFQPHIAGQPVGRSGFDSIELTFYQDRWWITSINTDWEGT